jgi:glyoxylase I family protein
MSGTSTSKNFCGIHHCSFLVANTRKALAFYEGILGLQQAKRADLNFPGAWLDVGGDQQIHLLELTNPDPVEGRPVHGGRDRHLALRVADFDLVRTRLKQHGVAFNLSKSGRKALFCRDPDGNTLEIIAI